MITRDEKLAELAPKSALLQRCDVALRASSYMGAILELDEQDSYQDIEIATCGLLLAGWVAERVQAEDGCWRPITNGTHLRIVRSFYDVHK